MHKSLTPILPSLAGLLLLGVASAQDTQPAAQSSKPAQSTTSTQSKTSAAKKPASSAAKPATAVALTTQKQKASYALGMNVGTGMRRQGVADAVDPALVAHGLRDALSGGKTALTEDEMKAALQQLANEVRTAQETKGRKEGEAFLAANKTKDGVKVLPDGLQYKVLTEGNGPKPTASDSVTVNYRGTFVNGQEFDSSYSRGQPTSFQVGGVIKGWTEALQLMPVGSKWQLFIPADLAYGDSGKGGIPPASTLIFEVELLSIGDQKK